VDIDLFVGYRHLVVQLLCLISPFRSQLCYVGQGGWRRLHGPCTARVCARYRYVVLHSLITTRTFVLFCLQSHGEKARTHVGHVCE